MLADPLAEAVQFRARLHDRVVYCFAVAFGHPLLNCEPDGLLERHANVAGVGQFRDVGQADRNAVDALDQFGEWRGGVTDTGSEYSTR